MSSMVARPGRRAGGGLCTTAAQAAGTEAGRPDPTVIVFQQKPDFALWSRQEDRDRGRRAGLRGRAGRPVPLLLAAPGHGLRGWTHSSAVISLRLAEEYFTQAITIRPPIRSPT